jgi:acrylyl-CoA reductase (NADPH)
MDLYQRYDSTLSADARILLEVARRFADDAATALTAAHRTSEWPGELLKRGCEAGLAGIEVPRAQGGRGLSFGARIRVAEILARADLPFAFAIINHHNVAQCIAAGGSDAALARYVPGMLSGELIGCWGMSEPGAGSDFTAIRTRATRVAGGWRLDGEKRWVANARGAALAMVFAQTAEHDSAGGIACFIVDLRTAGCARVDDDIAGMAPAGIGGLRFDGCLVPEENLLHPPGSGFRQALAGVNRARVHVCAMASGLLHASLSDATRYCAQRQAFGKPLLEHQGLRWQLVDVAQTLEVMRMLTLRGVAAIEAGDDDVIVAAALAKKFSGEQCVPAVAACAQALGAEGTLAARGHARRLLAARAMCIADGSTEMMNERLGASLLQRYAAHET